MFFIVDKLDSVNGFNYSNRMLINQSKDSVSIITNISISRDGESLDNNYTCIELSQAELVKLRDALIVICPIKEGEE